MREFYRSRPLGNGRDNTQGIVQGNLPWQSRPRTVGFHIVCANSSQGCCAPILNEFDTKQVIIFRKTIACPRLPESQVSFPFSRALAAHPSDSYRRGLCVACTSTNGGAGSSIFDETLTAPSNQMWGFSLKYLPTTAVTVSAICRISSLVTL